MDTQLIKEFMLKTTREAGKVALSRFGRHGNVDMKSHPLDLVSEADKSTNQLFVKRINQAFPDHGIISEEFPTVGADNKVVWIIDPIDGTLNYIKGIPCWAIIVGVRINGQMEMSCVYNPIMGEMYFAERGKGAFRGISKIQCSDQSELMYSVGLTNDSISEQRLNFLDGLESLVSWDFEPTETEQKRVIWASSNGCTAISCGWVADGRKDWYYCSGGGGIWDYEGTVFLLQESGCVVTSPDGSEWQHGNGPFIAANPTLHAKLVELFNDSNDFDDDLELDFGEF